MVPDSLDPRRSPKGDFRFSCCCLIDPRKFKSVIHPCRFASTLSLHSLKQILIYLSIVLLMLIHLQQTLMRGEIIASLSPSYVWRRARNRPVFKVTLEKQIRAGARSGSLRFGTNTNHENTPSLLIPCMYSSDLLSASIHSTSEIHKAHSQSH